MRQQKAAILKDQSRALDLTIDAGGSSGRLVAEVKEIGKSFGDRTIIRGFSTRIIRGDRIAVVGPNGAGKTTLVKLLLGELSPDEGSVKLGTHLQTVYLDQARDELKRETTLWGRLDAQRRG